MRRAKNTTIAPCKISVTKPRRSRRWAKRADYEQMFEYITENPDWLVGGD